MENKNQPAFPTIGDVRNNPEWLTENGLTKREYIAAKAMQGMLSMTGSGPDEEALARAALAYADALLAELEK